MHDTIEVHQTLHGYGDGHQLLASSLDLTHDQQWQLLVMSDLSGPSFRVGFESYITGYPLAAGGFYCLARTWYAAELPRPGCVWTHTILVSDSDLARIQDFRGVLSQFRRPSSLGDLDAYGRRITVRPIEPKPYNLDSGTSSLLLHLLYGSLLRAVVLTSESSQGYEELAIAVINQQWPRLRRSFSFCTGVLAPGDTNFDLAIAPPDAIRPDTDARKVATPASAPTAAANSAADWHRSSRGSRRQAASRPSASAAWVASIATRRVCWPVY